MTTRDTPPSQPPAAHAAEADEDALAELGRLTSEELAFLLGGGAASDGAADPAEAAERQRRQHAERNHRANVARTRRRHEDPAYAERLRAGDRERQRRRRAGDAVPPEPPAPAAALPPISAREAARRLLDHLRHGGTAQAAQLRRRPELMQRYVDGFVLYRSLASGGARPTRGAIAAAFRTAFGVALTPSQVQKLRDHVEGFAGPGGPWHQE